VVESLPRPATPSNQKPAAANPQAAQGVLVERRNADTEAIRNGATSTKTAPTRTDSQVQDVGDEDNLTLYDNAQEGLGLLLLTWLLEIPGIIARWIFLMFLSLPIYLVLLAGYFRSISGLNPLINDIPSFFDYSIVGEIPQYAFFLAVLPLLLSVASIIVPGGATVTKWAMGARRPSQREQELFKQARSVINARNQKEREVILPHNWFVVDKTDLTAFVVGTTLYVTREMLKSPYLPAVLAHELGHINSWDGRLTLILRRLIFPPFHWLAQATLQPAPGTLVVVGTDPLSTYYYAARVWLLSLALSILGGGFGLWLLSPLWTYFWQYREYIADRYASKLGFAAQLEEFLEQHQHFDAAVPYYLSSHPYTELRIDYLQAYQRLP
jgi:Zn-dependent protease with chaperone function